MDKKTIQMIKGIAILIMLAHHFIVFSFSELPHGVMVFGAACKICVAIYAVLSGYGYFFAREKTVRYALKKVGDCFKYIGFNYSHCLYRQLWWGAGN